MQGEAALGVLANREEEKMHISCAAYSFRDALNSKQMTLEKFLEKSKEMGLDGVELTAYYFPETSEEYLKRLKRLAFRYGLDISGTAVGNNFCQADSEKRREHIAMVKKWLDISAILGAPCLRVFAGSTPQGHTEEEARKWTIDALKECAEYASSKGVMLALENHGGITGTADQTISLIKAVDSEWVGINLDCGNYRQSPYEEIEKTAPYAITVHAKTHIHTPSGIRELDYDRIIQTLKGAGYRGYLTIEYEEKEDPFVAVPRFARQLLHLVRKYEGFS